MDRKSRGSWAITTSGGHAPALQICLVWQGLCTLPKELLDKFHISRGVKQRALRSLEEAGLVSIAQETGHSPVVTLRKV